MRFLLLFLLHIFTFISLASAMSDSPEDLLKAHHIAIKKSLERKLSLYPQEVKDTCHHFVDRLIPLEMSERIAFSLISKLILKEEKHGNPRLGTKIDICKRPRDIHAKITFLSENRAELISPLTSMPMRHYGRWICHFLGMTLERLQLTLNCITVNISKERTPEEKKAFFFSVISFDLERSKAVDDRKATFVKGLDEPWDRLRYVILKLTPPCIEALSKHAETFFYKGKLDEQSRSHIVFLFSGTIYNFPGAELIFQTPRYISPLTAAEIDYLGQITLPLVSDGDTPPGELSSRLEDIIRVVLRGE